MNIAVTGGLGFIGSNLIQDLAKNQDYNINCIVRPDDDISILKNQKVNLIKCNIFNLLEIKTIIKNIDVIIHLAATIKSKNKDIISKNNIDATRNLLDSCTGQHFIFASSTLAVEPLDAYSLSKKKCEDMIIKKDINYTILRMGPVFGPGDEKGTITKIIRSIKLGKTIPIPGKGDLTFQPTFVGDVIQAIKKIIMNKDFYKKTCTLVGNPIKTDDFIKETSKILNNKPKKIYIPLGVLKPIVRVYEKISTDPLITLEQLNNLSMGSHTKIFQSDFTITSLNESITLTVKQF